MARRSMIGIPDQVSAGWSGYSREDVAAQPERVHYDVLRQSGFSESDARARSSKSAERQKRLVDTQRQELGAEVASGWRPSAAGRSLFITPSFGPLAGRLCLRDDDGTLTPVDELPPPPAVIQDAE